MNTIPHWSTLLAPDPELELIKDVVMKATRILKAHNDTPPISAPRTAKEWREYGKEHGEW